MSEIDVTETTRRRGEYTGDGNVTQDIVLPMRPKFVKILAEAGTQAWLSDGDNYVKMHYTNTSGTVRFGKHSSAIVITDNGFTVSSAYTNALDVVYVFEWEV